MMLQGKSAEDAAFTSLTVGVHFVRDRFEHQRQLFESSTNNNIKTAGSNNNSGRAAPIITLASDGSSAPAAAAGKKQQPRRDSGTIHAMVAALPPPRLDFIAQELVGSAAKKNNGNKGDDAADGNKKKSNNDDDDEKDGADADAAAEDKRQPVKPAGRKQVGNFLDKNAVTVKGANAAKPGAVPVTYLLQHFSELLRAPYSTPQHVVDNLFARQLSKPTTIQALAIPLLAHDRRNVLGCAPTGQGKTLSFLIPMFSILRAPDPTSEGVRALVVAPTKELAAQIEREAQFLMKGAAWRVVQHGHTTKGKDLFVTTPARAVSMAASGHVVLNRVQYLVFDEGDKLWEGVSDFSTQVRQIVNYVHGVKQPPPSQSSASSSSSSSAAAKSKAGSRSASSSSAKGGRSGSSRSENKKDKKSNAGGTVVAEEDAAETDAAEPSFKYRDGVVTAFFSATLPKPAEKIARTFMHDPVLIVIRGRTNANVDCEQRLVFTGNEIGKVTEIRNMVQQGDMKPPVLIFVQSIERAKELHDEIRAAKLRVAMLHADLSPEDRDAVVLKFRMGEIWVLITTELLARGVDFKGVETVINFDIPLTPESYVHCVGRTGRAGKRGTAVTFFTEDDKMRIGPIAKIVHESGFPVEQYLLELPTLTRHQLRGIQRTVPNRLAVSTRKRARIGEERIMRQANKYCRKDGEEANDGDDDDADNKPRQKSSSKGTAKRSTSSKKKVPTQSEEFDDFE